MEKESRLQFTSMGLHLLAMAAMLCDHLRFVWYSAPGFLNGIGRIAFPIFAFLLVEGYCHTRNLKKYALRMFLFALLSEVPFDLMITHTPLTWEYQNVMWTFLMGLGLIHLNRLARKSSRAWLPPLAAAASVLLAFYPGEYFQTDYSAAGLLTVLVFWFYRKPTVKNRLFQFVLIGCINYFLLGTYLDPVTVFGWTFFFPRQLFALLAFIPIWLYKGKQGLHNKPLQYLCYAFYPLHLLIIALTAMYLY